MSNALRAASGRTMDRNNKQLHAVDDKSDKCGKPCKSSQPSESNDGHSCPCHCARTCNCVSGECADDDGNDTINDNTIDTNDNKLRNQDGNENRNKVGIKIRNESGRGISSETTRIVTDCYEHPAAIRPEGEGAGSRVRIGTKHGDHKLSDKVSRAATSNNNGLSTGATRWN